MQLDPNFLFSGVVQILILLLAISVHESAHAWTAWRSGDSTAYDAGRVTLNPLRHIDPLGSLLLPAMLFVAGAPVFGWAKPTPVRVDKLRDPKRDHLLVTAAGPLSNVVLGLLALVALWVSLAVVGPDGRLTAQLILFRDLAGAQQSVHFPWLFALVHFAFLNGFLAVFNLLPIPPLDGGQITLNLLPPDWAAKYAAIRPYGFIIVLGLAMINALALLVVPVYALIAFVIHFHG
ncbi:MAG: site-2 protease family protein [Acidobacteriota bacterium]|nr:site-2 protease family protein [Acidobacteriota bacterium]